MSARMTFLSWPVVRQLTGDGRLGRGQAVTSARTAAHAPRTTTAGRVVKSVCPSCAAAPTGPDVRRTVNDYCARAGVTVDTGNAQCTPPRQSHPTCEGEHR